MCPLSECLLEVDADSEDFVIICNGTPSLEVESAKEVSLENDLEVESPKEASLEAGRGSSLVLAGKEKDLEDDSSKEAPLEAGPIASLFLAGKENDLEDARAEGPECSQPASPAHQRSV